MPAPGTSRPDQLAELRQLLNAQSDGSLDASAHARLADLLRTDPAARAYYIDHMSLDAALAGKHSPRVPLMIPTEANADRGPRNAEVPSTPARPASAGRPQRFDIPNSAVYAAAALVAIATVLVALYLLAFSTAPSDIEHRPSNIEHPPLATLIEATPGSNLSTPGGFISEGRDYPRGEYSLDRGAAEFMLTNSVNVRLRGETRLHMSNDMHVSLTRGSARFVVPEHATGFTVHLPGGVKIVDLGTAFRIDLRDGLADITVTEGDVRLDHGDESSRLLAVGQSVRIDSQTGAVVAESHSSEPLPPRDGSYRELVLSMSPTAYLPMDAMSDPRTLVDLGRDRNHGSIHRADDASAFVEGVSGDAIHLRGPASGDYAMLPNYTKPTEQLTVVAWVKADSRPRHATIAKNWGSSGLASIGQFHFDLWEDAGDLAAAVGQADGTHVVVREEDPTPLELNVWHHVALVVTGTEAILYRNGRRIATVPCDGLHHDTPIPHVGIGVKPTTAEPRPDSGYWHGALDELAIFDTPLDEQQIRALYDAAKPEPTESEDRESGASS